MAGLSKLYEAIEEKLGDKYNVSYEALKEDIADGEDNVCGIFLYVGQNDVRDYDDYTYEVVKAHVQVHTDGSIEKTDEAIEYLRNFVDRIENEDSLVDGLEFVSCQHLGAKALPIGKNSYDTQVCVSNIEILYNLNS